MKPINTTVSEFILTFSILLYKYSKILKIELMTPDIQDQLHKRYTTMRQLRFCWLIELQILWICDPSSNSSSLIVLPIVCCLFPGLWSVLFGGADGTKGIFGFCRMHESCSPASGPTLKKALCCTCPVVGRRINKILDETVRISPRAYAIGKGMNPSVFPLAMRK